MVRLPHPVVLMLLGVAVAAALTWVLPAGEFDRQVDPATGRRVVVAGTYHAVEAAPVGLLGTAVAVPRGIVAAAEVIAVVLLVGGAWVVVDRAGTLGRAVSALVRRFRRRGLWAIPVIAFLFALMGALENMGEEIIPLVPVLLLLGAGIGVDAIVVVAISVGAAAVGSAFGPTNPFQAGIAMKLAELPPLSGGALRLGMLLVGFGVWVLWTVRYAARNRLTPVEPASESDSGLTTRDGVILALAILPMFLYVYGALKLDWGFNELSGAFLISGIAIGLLARLGVAGTTETFLEGMQSMLPAAMMVGIARSISLVLEDGHIIDTILRWAGHPSWRGTRGGSGGADGTLPLDPSHSGSQRQRPCGVDDARPGPALRPPGSFPPSHGAGLPDRRRPDGTPRPDQRCPDGCLAGRQGPLPEMDPICIRRMDPAFACGGCWDPGGGVEPGGGWLMSGVPVAVVQAEVAPDLESGLARTASLAREAAAEGAKLVVFPETWLPGYPAWLDVCRDAALWDFPPVKAVFARMAANSVVVDGEAGKALGAIAAESGVTMVVGVIERVEAGPGRSTLYNSLLTYGPDGALLNHHRKLVPTYTERMVWGNGDAQGLQAVETPAGRVGGLICWEHWMPLARQAMHDSGEDIHVAAWPTAHEMHQVASRQYAFEGRCFVLAAGSLAYGRDLPPELEAHADRVPGPDTPVLRGGSAIIGPDGSYLVGPVYERTIILHAVLELDRVREEAMTLDVSGHYSRPDCLEFTVNRERRA